MKTKYLILALALITLGITGCKKDDSQTSDSKTDVKASLKTTQQLLSFREQLKLKSSNSLPVDSATWYLEGLLNFENANNNHQFDGLTFYYDTLIMYTASGALTLTELDQAYTYFTNNLNSLAQSQSINDFAYNSVNISITSSGLKNGETKLVLGAGWGSNTVGNYAAFGQTDYWKWGFGGGKCDYYAGQGGTSDAAQELNYRFNHPIALPEPGYFTAVEGVYAWGSEFPDVNNPGPYCDYKIFHYNATNTGIWPCIGPDELNYYLSVMPYIINAKRIENKSYMDVYVGAFFPPNGTSIYDHYYYLQYGDFSQYN